MDIETAPLRTTAPPRRHSGARDRVRNEIWRNAQSHSWLVRLPLSAILTYLLARHLTDFTYQSLVGGIDLIMHEAGHLFFLWFGNDVLTVMGGTLFQLACPLAVAGMFLHQRDHYGVTVAIFWVGINLAEIAPYVADARSQLPPLVSPFPGAPIHDWGFLLGRAGLLSQDQLVARGFHDAGILVMTVGLASGLWVLKVMYDARVGMPEHIAS